jgi:diguanylate cyclase (GGDEF)-like protein
VKRLTRTYDKRLTADEAEQISRVTVYFNLVALVFLGLFALVAYRTHDRQYALTLITVMAISSCNLIFFYLSGRMRLLVLMTCLGYLPFCAFLQINGGQNNSGILWHYVYPIMVYYIAGLRLGSLCSGGLILMETILMLMDDFSFFHAYYSFDFKLRFIASMTVMSVFGAMLEYSRNTAQKNLIVLAKKLEKASETDELTGLPNRRALKEILENEVVRVTINGGDFSILLCDIDYFKAINDQYGHAVGDKVLQHLAALFNALIRKHDVAARWGGEEFLLVLPDTASEESLLTAERIRSGIEQTPLHGIDGGTIQLTISCGVCNWRESPQLDELFRHADNRLYQAKAMGRNKVVGLACP